MYLCRCSNQGPGCQLLIDQGAGQNKTQMLCANSWGIMVSVFSHHLVTEFMLMQMQSKQYVSTKCLPYIALSFNMLSTLDACSLYFSGTSRYFRNYYTGSFSTMTELIDNVDCTGTESKLTDCSHDTTLQNSYTSPRVECLSCE